MAPWPLARFSVAGDRLRIRSPVGSDEVTAERGGFVILKATSTGWCAMLDDERGAVQNVQWFGNLERLAVELQARGWRIEPIQ